MVTAPAMEYACSEGFEQLLDQLGISLGVTTYQSGQLCLIHRQGGKTQITTHSFEKPMGLFVHDRGFLLGTLTQVWSFMNAPNLAKRYFPDIPCDAVYVPQMSYVTGNMAVHDVVAVDYQAIAVSSMFSCLVSMSPEYSFVPLWKPKFITGLAAEDRCHLNGIALEHGKPRYVTALGETDTAGGWRSQRLRGGCLIDLKTNDVVYRGLCMPHAPRLYQGDLWLLNSGTGELGIMTPHGWEALLFLPGFLRGLAFVGPIAFVGLSKLRDRTDQGIFENLPLEQRTEQLQCAVYAINIKTGAVLGWLQFTQGIAEIYDVQIFPCRYPLLATLQKGELREVFHLPQSNAMLKKK